MQANPPRCLGCSYDLEGLDRPRCPECGRPFDRSDPTTFSRRPPFLFWRMWLPGLSLALITGVMLFAFLLIVTQIGWAATIAAPVAIGTVAGYRWFVGRVMGVLLSVCLVVGLLISLVVLDLSGLMCGAMAAVVIGVPVMVGSLLGYCLRRRLKRSGYDQAGYLPIVFMLLVPLGVAAVESRFAGVSHIEVIRTETALSMSQQDAWRRLAFYEDLPQKKPWLLRWLAPVPLRTVIEHTTDGVVRTCVYDRGHVTKKVTDVAAPARLAFDIVEQSLGEERSVELLGGSFEFVALSDHHTRVVLSTRYRPKLTPRWCWRPLERWVAGSIHEHVLAGMRDGSGDSTLASAVAEQAP